MSRRSDPSRPPWASMTKAEHDEAMTNRQRPMTDEHPGKRTTHPDHHPKESIVDIYLASIRSEL